MITQVHFQNFKLLRDVTLDLGRLNIIVGRNAIGKSSVLEGLHYLLQLLHEKPGEGRSSMGRVGMLFSGPRSLQRLVSKPDGDALSVEVHDQEGHAYGLEGRVTASNQDGRVRLWFDASPDRFELAFPVSPGATSKQEVSRFFARPYAANLGSVLRLRLDASQLAAASYSEDETPRLEYNGSGLASVLNYLAGLRDGTLEAIEADLARVVPGVLHVRTLPARVTQTEKVRIAVNDEEHMTEQKRTLTGSRFEVELEKVGWLSAEQLSEGTLLALGLFTVMRFRPPRLLLLDDIDKALHPLAQKQVVGLLRNILEANPRLQIIATSHSPFVLDELRPEEVFVAGGTDPTRSHIRRLDTHPSWPKRSGYMHPGEFWSFVGEGWVAESLA